MTKKNDYWKEREKEWIEKNIRDDKAFARSLSDHYDKMLKSITDDINRFYMNYAAREKLSMEEAIKKVADFDVQAFEKMAAKMVKEKDFSEYANERLRIYNATMRINRLEMLKAQIGLEVIAANSEMEKELKFYLDEKYRDEIERQAGILGKHTFNVSKKNLEGIINASFHGANWSQRLWVSNDELKNTLDSLLSRAMIQGMNPKNLASYLRPLLKDEVANRKFIAERLAITETARVQDQAQMDSFRKFGFEYCVWIAEPTACGICEDIAEKNNGVYRIDEVPSIPAHPVCRCSKSAHVPKNSMLKGR